MADLRPGRARALGRLMLALHADFRARHGLPPVPHSWSLRNDLHVLQARSSLVDDRLLASPKRVIGGPLKAIRSMLWTVLKPLFYRQSEVNRDVLLILETLARDSEARRSAHDALSARIAALETAVSRLRLPTE